METPTPPAEPQEPSSDPKALRAAVLDELSLWLHDALIMARRIAEIQFGVTKNPLAPHELDAIVRTGTALFQTAVMLQSQQQTLQQVSRQFRGIEAPPEVRKALIRNQIDADTLFRGKGCDRCRRTGYSGRCGIYEFLVMDDMLRDMVAGRPNVTELRRYCQEHGMIGLRDDGIRKVRRGVTTIEEVLSATEDIQVSG